MTSTCLFLNGQKSRKKFWGMQYMDTRLLSANLDFDSRFQHVSCCVPDKCHDSSEFRGDLVFSFFWTKPRSHVWSGCDERFTWLAVLTRTPVFVAKYLFSWILRKLSCPWYLRCLDQQRRNLVNMREYLNGPEHLCKIVSF